MTIKPIIAALALAAGLAPALALAQGCDHDRRVQISCAEGQQWDAKTASCVTISS